MTSSTLHYIKVKQMDETLENKVFDELGLLIDPDTDAKNIAVENMGDYEVMFLFMNDYKVKPILDVLTSFDVVIDSKELTADALMGRIKGGDWDYTFDSDEYSGMLEDFLRTNLDVDIVLDKINESGIDSLTSIDKEVLSA